jgi:hypothetical protein
MGEQVRFIKMLGLAALAAVAVTALLGAASASASVEKTVLCKVNQELCKAENLWGSEVTIKTLSTKAILLGTLKVECHSEATILAESSDKTQILGKITALTWSGCTNCPTVTTTKLPSGTLLHTSGQNGLLHTTSLTEVVLKGCGFFFECIAKASTALLTFTGGAIGSTALAEANEVPTEISGSAFCGSSGKWDAGPGTSEPYVVTEVNGSKTGSIFVSLKSHL